MTRKGRDLSAPELEFVNNPELKNTQNKQGDQEGFRSFTSHLYMTY